MATARRYRGRQSPGAAREVRSEVPGESPATWVVHLTLGADAGRDAVHEGRSSVSP
jgi:hypothetical protein